MVFIGSPASSDSDGIAYNRIERRHTSQHRTFQWEHMLLKQFRAVLPHYDIAYCLAVLAFRCQHSLAPSYLSDELRRASDVDSRRRQFWSFRSQSTARSVTALSPSLRRKYGKLCRLTSHLHPHYRHSNGDWKLSFSSTVMHPTVPIYSRYCLAMHENNWCYVTLKLFCVTSR